jgi:hypothetical protein
MKVSAPHFSESYLLEQARCIAVGGRDAQKSEQPPAGSSEKEDIPEARDALPHIPHETFPSGRPIFESLPSKVCVCILRVVLTRFPGRSLACVGGDTSLT